MTENLKPLVTFAIVAYNQERYIRQAIAGALSQTYSPLEIILSDDCSTDSTFLIMSEIVTSYTGIHKIVLNINSKNLGLALHVNAVVELAEGVMIVGAAGDDISCAERVEKIMEMKARHPEADAFWSQVIMINENGEELGPLYKQVYTPCIENILRGNQMVLGASLAFTKEVFEYFGKLTPSINNEDFLISFRAALLGGCIYLPEPLVKYRIHDGSYSQQGDSCRDSYPRKYSYTQGYMPSLFQALVDLQLYCNKETKDNLNELYFNVSNILLTEIDKKHIYCLIYSRIIKQYKLAFIKNIINSKPSTIFNIIWLTLKIKLVSVMKMPKKIFKLLITIKKVC